MYIVLTIFNTVVGIDEFGPISAACNSDLDCLLAEMVRCEAEADKLPAPKELMGWNYCSTDSKIAIQPLNDWQQSQVDAYYNR